MSEKVVLVTGAAGFIGFHLSKSLLQQGYLVVGIDSLNDYYDVNLKKERLKQIDQDSFQFLHGDICDQKLIDEIFDKYQFTYVINLAAYAGVRYSIENPRAYINSNINGFINILEACRHNKVQHLVFASSSSVYGGNKKMPFSVSDNVDHPLSLYAATKKSNELMAHTYASLYGIPATGLRFFSVYGPWGRPDMALFLFTKAIYEGKPIKVYNHGRMKRDFTYVDDIVQGIMAVLKNPPKENNEFDRFNPDPANSFAPYRLYNIGNNTTVELEAFISIIENKIGLKAIRDNMPMQPGDVPEALADVDPLIRDVNFKPETPIEVGISRFIDWYKMYFNV